MPTNFNESFLSGGNIQFIEALYARYLEDPSSVDASWQELFRNAEASGKPIIDGPPLQHVNGKNGHVNNGTSATVPVPVPLPAPVLTRPLSSPSSRPVTSSGRNGHATPAAAALAPDVDRGPDKGLQARVDQAVYAFRLRGHLLAQLDPLGRARPPLEDDSDLSMVEPSAFTSSELEQVVDSAEVFPQKSVRLSDLLDRLRRTYCGHIGVEYMFMLDSERRSWLRQHMEHAENRAEFNVEAQRGILTKLSNAEAFEQVMIVKDGTNKRFSADGAEAMVPMIDTMLEVCGETGVAEVVIGMAHRGRLNVLTNILKKSSDQIYSEFFGPSDPKAYLGRGDVKYHMGFSSDHVTKTGKQIHLSLAFNPSHLEIVNPVVQGRVRAKQDRKHDEARGLVLPLLIHGDAAFSGQGVVAETLNLMALRGYNVGGTIHLVVNNQVGFTTDPEDARSFRYCTGFAQMLDIPIFHVNGDDPEACCYVMRLATEYRQRFKSDVVIDLVCYRRFGHNEADDPSLTQPKMYELIHARPKVRQLYAESLAAANRISLEESEALRQKCFAEFTESYERVKKANAYKSPSHLEGLWKNYQGGASKNTPSVATSVAKDKLVSLLNRIGTVPEGFTFFRQINQLLEKRRKMAAGEMPLDWGAAEHLAYATLLTEKTPIRLTGQDCERGTFTHRHAVLHDSKTGQTYTPLDNLSPDQAPLWIYNSPLSEMGPMGFEFGFSLDYPDALVMWEAQFGDFANMAQGIIDQFISASEEKWKRFSGLVLLLPHGYEGQGPEHSSARLERFLDLCGDDNIQVVNATTPAQIFHVLRRQVVRPYRKPLVVMSPKMLLRFAPANSSLDELATGSFQHVIADPTEPKPNSVEKLILCSGKIYYDLAEARAKVPDSKVALVRVEQLYPFPQEEVEALLKSYSKLKSVLWVQEEPQNMGAWRYMLPRLEEMLEQLGKENLGPVFVGRAEAASPATGVVAAHKLEQEMIVERALSRGGNNRAR
jgi:2-oxoglutarate dehydrogenase E1 component